MGINLIRALLARGQQVVSLDLAPFTYPEAAQVTAHVGDIREAATVRAAMQGCTQVIHCAAALPLYSPQAIYSTDVDGTRRVLESARDLGVERVVVISSTAVYGVPDHHPITETDRVQGVGAYGEAKIAAEAVCQEFRAAGLCVPILRPKSFVGPERLGVFSLLYEWAQDGHNFPLLGTGRTRYQLLDVEDLCEAIWRCLTGPRAQVDDVFNIGAQEFQTLREDFQAVLDAAGHGKRIILLPAGPAIALLKVLEAMKLSPLYQWVYETAATDSWVSVEKAARVLGFIPCYSNQDALLRNFAWYRANRATFAGQQGISHRVPWQAGALALAKWFF